MKLLCKKVMDLITEGNSIGVNLLRKQFLNARLDEMVNETGKGFIFKFSFTDYDIEKFSKDFCFGDIDIYKDNGKIFADTIVFVEKGILNRLEVASYYDVWDVHFDDIIFKYRSPVRDFSILDESL